MPSKEYFWKVYFVLNKDNFRQLVSDKIAALKKKNRIKNDLVKATAEAIDIMKSFKFEENLSLLRGLSS